MMETKDLQKTVESVISQMSNLTVTTQEQYTEAAEFLKKCKVTAKTVEEYYSADLLAAQEKKKAAEAERKSVSDKIKAFTDQLDKAERTVKKIMSDFLTEQERIRREAEQKRIAAEEEKRLNAAVETGEDFILDLPIPAAEQEPKFKAEGTYSVTVWDFEIIDPAKINPAYMIPDEKAIRATVVSMKEKAQDLLGPGVRVTSRKDMRVRL